MLTLGFDGGGSTARLAIAGPTGEIVFRATGTGVNPMDNESWRAPFTRLFAEAGELFPRVGAACLGLPGWGEVPRLDDEVGAWLDGTLPCPSWKMNDVELAHRAAFDNGDGILLLSGTGSMGMGRARDGAYLRAGGFGDQIGDEGSAFAIGRAALARLTHEIDGRAPRSGLGEALALRLGIPAGAGPEAATRVLMAWLYGHEHGRSGIARLAVDVDAAARAGDPVAAEHLDLAAHDLALHYEALVRRLDAGRPGWSFAGSVFRAPRLLASVGAAIGTDPRPAVREALDAAIMLARGLR